MSTSKRSKKQPAAASKSKSKKNSALEKALNDKDHDKAAKLRDAAKTTALVKKSEVNSLIQLVMEGHDLGLTPAQEEAHKRITRAHVTLQPARLRVCDITCPMHDSCPFIIDIALANRPYGRRCPYEAEMMQIAFDQNIAFVKSMDPSYDKADSEYDIPDYEKGLCLEVAFYTVIEHRLSLYVAQSPSATLHAPVPGAAGGTKEEENPAYTSWARAVDKKAKYQDKLQKSVEARLKRVSQRMDARVTTLEAVKRIFEENREGLEKSGYKNLFSSADNATEANVEEIKRKAGHETEESGGG